MKENPKPILYSCEGCPYDAGSCTHPDCIEVFSTSVSEIPYGCMLNDCHSTLLQINQMYERQGLAACPFEVVVVTPEGDIAALTYESPAWNLQEDLSFTTSALFTGIQKVGELWNIPLRIGTWNYSDEAPIEVGWYWMKLKERIADGFGTAVEQLIEVFRRPGHDYLCVQINPCDHVKRNFIDVRGIGAQWSGPIPRPEGE